MNVFLLNQLLEKSAEKFPNNIAVECNGNVITYKDLNEKSTALAHILIDNGVAERSVVTICLEKSIESVIAFFGVLKSSCAYIPMDSNYFPEQRIKKIIQISEAKHLITNSNAWEKIFSSKCDQLSNVFLIENLIRDEKVIVVKGDHAKAVIGKKDIQSGINSNVIDNDLAYILYTSGSTGVPKGVMISHRNALAFVKWSLDYFSPESQDVFSNHAPHHFDISVFDLFVSIACGASVHLLPFAIGNNPRSLLQWIKEHKITYWYSVPSILIALINHSKITAGEIKSLKKILFAGETFPTSYLKKLIELIPQCDYYNLYGPTETNVCTYFHVKEKQNLSDRPVPIGYACSNCEVVVLDDDMRNIPVGSKGMLYVRGATVTSGYYNDPKRTKEAFVPSPFAHHNNEQLYKTGDIVKMLDDNCYEFVGRADFMVKCSGYRVELQEIENVLYRLKNIKEAVVVPYFNENRGNTLLYSKVVIDKNNYISIIDIKKYLAESLPFYMIPEIIDIDDELPKNQNGKIDREKIKSLIAI